MRKLWLLVLWLLCGAILPLTTNAKIEDGIYTVEGWHKTVIRSGIQLTLASGALEWTYYRGFNENTDNSEWIGDWNDWTWTYYFWGKMYGNTNTVDDAWWGSGDNVENWFNSWLNPARQWPCESWRHVPSKWERSNLHIARCNNDVSCDVSVDLNIDNEKIAYIDNLVAKFSETFNIQIWWGSEYWLSSPYYNLKNSGSLVYRYYDGVTIDVGSRQQNYKVLCFKDVIIKPQTYKVSFFSGNQLVTSWEIIDGWLRNEDIPSATKEWYDFDYRYVEWAEDTGFNFSGTAITWNISLYAKWTPVEYAITYELDGWTNSENNVTWYTIETPDITFANPTKEWYNFDGWFTDTQFTTWVTTIPTWTTWNITLYAKWTPVEYAITYELDGWTNSENNTWIYTIETPDITLENPTKDWYTFNGWFTDTQFTTWVTTIPTWTTWNITLYAKWTENKKSSWSSGWGGRSSNTSNKDKDTTNNPSVTDVTAPLESGAQWDSNDGSPLSRGDTASAERGSTQNYTQEFQEAYEFAKEKWITTMLTINEANMDWKLTRIAMAKMLSQYAMNVLWQKPANIVTPKFNDVTDKQNSDYDDWVTLAYQLWIMWQNMPNNKFRPNDEVTRAEFATALSRMIYHTSDGEYKSTPKYYIHHMEKLVKEWIITKDDPNMKELRWYVMIMLMRSAK